MPDLLDAIDRLDAALLPAALARIAARLAAAAATDPADELLTVDDVARLLKVTKKFCYNNAAALGVVRLSRRKVRFSRKTVTRYIERRKG